MRFYLGIHEPHWMTKVDVPVMVSRNRLGRLGHPLPTSSVPWVLDSGGFTEIAQHGRWRMAATEYADRVQEIAETVGMLEWAAPQDWMCEPQMIERTGKSVEEHQELTVSNFVELRAMLGGLVIPVLQGQTPDEYLQHVGMYMLEGFNLRDEPIVGLGSVCRRENTTEIVDIVTILHPLRLHGFGCKAGAIRRVGGLLASVDSMAWSYAGRRRGPCGHLKSRCANHLHYALEWRERTLTRGSTESTPAR